MAYDLCGLLLSCNSWFFTRPDPDPESAAEECLEDPIQAAGEVIKDEIAMTTFTGIDIS